MNNSDFKCISCDKNYTSKYYLKKHIESCKLIKIQLLNNNKLNDKEHYEKIIEDLKLDFKNTITEIELKNTNTITEIERKYANYIDEIEHKNSKNINEIENKNYVIVKELKDTIVNKDIIISELRTKNNILSNEVKDDKNVLIKYLSTKNADIINNNSNNNNINSTTINNNVINNYDPTMIAGKMTKSLIGDERDLANHVVNNGLNMCYRTTDKSRHTLLWNDESGNKIKDSKGFLLASAVSETMKIDMINQKEHVMNRMIEMDKRKPEDISMEQYSKYNKVKQFSDNVISKDITTMNNIGIQLSKLGNKPNTIVKAITTNTLLVITEYISVILEKQYDIWLNLDFFNFGVWLYKVIKTKISKVMREPNYPLYVIIKDDINDDRQIFTEDMYNIIHNSISYKIEVSIALIMQLIKLTINYNEQNVNNMIEWIKHGYNDDHTNQFMEGIYEQYINEYYIANNIIIGNWKKENIRNNKNDLKK